MSQTAYPCRRPLIAIVAALLATSPAAAQNDYYFGDSDLEQGNAQIIAGQNAADRAPYYCAAGLWRDSNGPVWPERITGGLEAVQAASEPYTSLNFAVSGAHMTARGDDALPIATGVSTQIALFGALQDHRNIVVGPKDRFFIHAGTNDMLRVLEGEDPALVRTDLVAAARDHVASLAARGARTIVVSQVQPVEYLPVLRDDALAGLRDLAAQFAAQTNTDLVPSLRRLKSGLPDGTNIVLIDQPAFFEHVRGMYQRLGFATFDTACYEPATEVLCSTNPAEQNQHVFFDSNHFSAAGHLLYADWVRATLAGASGAAARGAGRMDDALANSGARILAESESARHVMAGQGGQPFVFAAPILARSHYLDNAGGDLTLRQTGGLFGLQLPLGAASYAALSLARLEQAARAGSQNRFSTSEWSLTGGAGLTLGNANIMVYGSYARPRITGFRRDTGALGMIATTGRVDAVRYSAGIRATSVRQWGALQLTSRGALDYTRIRINDFSEDNARGLALCCNPQSSGLLSLEVSTRLSMAPVIRSRAISAAPYVQLSRRTRLGGRVHTVTSTLIDNIADSAVLTLGRLDDTGTRVGGGFDIRLGAAIRLGIAYDHTVEGTGKRTHAVTAGLAISF